MPGFSGQDRVRTNWARRVAADVAAAPAVAVADVLAGGRLSRRIVMMCS